MMTDPNPAEPASTPLTVRRPATRVRGGVIVLQEAFGVNHHIVNLCDRLAAEGFVAVAPHLFHRTGDPTLGYEDFASIMPHIEKMTLAGVDADVDIAVATLEAGGIPPTSIGVTGFCLGGSITAYLAGTRRLGAAVTFYGGGIRGRWFIPSQLELAPRFRTPWLGLYGDLDKGIPVDDVEALRSAAATAPVPTEVVRYADADHGFNCDERASFHAASATDAWSRMLDWFDTHLD